MTVRRTEAIFVSIASYRDPECRHTLRDLFEKARHPGRVFVGLCWQGVSPDDDALLDLTARPAQIRCVRYDARVSRGACWAKSEAQKLWRGEPYLLNIDSHMRFAPGWEVEMIDLLHACPSPKPILSTYPAAYEPPDRILHNTPHLVAWRFSPHTGLPHFIGLIRRMTKPRRGAFFSGNFSFCSASFMAEVPYDPHLYFHGEEISMAVRAWSHGWDIFTPHRCLIHHRYSRPEHRHWDDHADWRRLNARSIRRVRHLLGLTRSRSPAVTVGLRGRFGLGRRRTRTEFEEFSGLFPKRRVITRRARFGKFEPPAGGR